MILDAQASSEVWSVLSLHERAWVSAWFFVLCHCFLFGFVVVVCFFWRH